MATASEMTGEPGAPEVRLERLRFEEILITNPAPLSRYVAGARMVFDGIALPSGELTLINPTVGETGVTDARYAEIVELA